MIFKVSLVASILLLPTVVNIVLPLLRLVAVVVIVAVVIIVALICCRYYSSCYCCLVTVCLVSRRYVCDSSSVSVARSYFAGITTFALVITICLNSTPSPRVYAYVHLGPEIQATQVQSTNSQPQQHHHSSTVSPLGRHLSSSSSSSGSSSSSSATARPYNSVAHVSPASPRYLHRLQPYGTNQLMPRGWGPSPPVAHSPTRASSRNDDDVPSIQGLLTDDSTTLSVVPSPVLPGLASGLASLTPMSRSNKCIMSATVTTVSPNNQQQQQFASSTGGSTINNPSVVVGQPSPTGTNAQTRCFDILGPSSGTHPASGATNINNAPTINQQQQSSAKGSPIDVSFVLYTRYNPISMSISDNGISDVASTPTGSVSSSSPSSSSSAPLGTLSLSSNNLVSTTSASGETMVYNRDVLDLYNETTLDESHLNVSCPIKIIIHGFGSAGNRPWVMEMAYKLLEFDNVNVIVVDWEKGAALPNYMHAASNTRFVGWSIARLIKQINARFGLTGDQYHLIGFSLGAHVAGFAGTEIRNSTSISRHWINRITGLDPASPLFENYDAGSRLDPSDAQFVDVIHSNGDGVFRGGLGSLQPMGHVDFYPNGGRVQVGCNSVIVSALSDIIYGKWNTLCNHRRALNFFMDSLEMHKCKFRSFSCSSYESYLRGECFDCGDNHDKCSYMGYFANYSKGRGKMYLTTHEDAPFCANQLMIKLIGTNGYTTSWGKVEVVLVTHDGKNETFSLSASSLQTSSDDAHEDDGASSMQSLIVSHPSLNNFTHALVRYTKYKGWIYSGHENWSIDKLMIIDSEGQIKSYCGYNTILESQMLTQLQLMPTNCTVLALNTNSIAPNGINVTPSMSRKSLGLASQQQQHSLQLSQVPQMSSRSPRRLWPTVTTAWDLLANRGSYHS